MFEFLVKETNDAPAAPPLDSGSPDYQPTAQAYLLELGHVYGEVVGAMRLGIAAREQYTRAFRAYSALHDAFLAAGPTATQRSEWELLVRTLEATPCTPSR